MRAWVLGSLRLRRTAARTSPRLDVQGLRALAVIAVILDHFLGWPSGGFVGVDVFFVVSGFLITGLLLREFDQTGSISFVGFYKRRIRRIMPAAVLVLGVTVAMSSLLFIPARARSLFTDAIWALLFSANWRFAAQNTDYFQAQGLVSPLQHYWSIGVEEQFYLVWPWLMLGVLVLSLRFRGRADRRTVFAVLVAMCGLSFGWALYQSAADANVANFSTLTRGWELGVGALLALIAPLLSSIRPPVRTVIAYIELAAVAAAMFLLSPEDRFPAPWAVVPVMGTALIIAAGTAGRTPLLGVLTNPVSTYLGDISYSLYLWHFPVIVFTATIFPSRSLAYLLACPLITVVVAALTYHLVEAPIHHSPLLDRFPRRSRRRAAWRTWRTDHASTYRYGSLVALGALCALLLAGVSVKQAVEEQVAVAQGATDRSRPAASMPRDQSGAALAARVASGVSATAWPEDLDPSLAHAPNAVNSELRLPGCLSVNAASLGDDMCTYGTGTRTAVVVGDSLAIAWLPALREVLTDEGYRVRGIGYPTCPFSTITMQINDGEEYSTACNSSRADVVGLINRLAPTIVINIDSEFSFQQTASHPNASADPDEWVTAKAAQLDAVGREGRRLIVLASNPGGESVASCATRVGGPSDCVTALSPAWKAKRQADRNAARVAGAEYYDTSSWFSSGWQVPAFAGTTVQRWDNGHLTPQYAALLVQPLRDLLFPE